MSPRKARGIAGDKTICLPIEEGVEYEDLVQKPKEYRAYLDKMREKYPEIFPEEMEKGYKSDSELVCVLPALPQTCHVRVSPKEELMNCLLFLPISVFQ